MREIQNIGIFWHWVPKARPFTRFRIAFEVQLDQKLTDSFDITSLIFLLLLVIEFQSKTHLFFWF